MGIREINSTYKLDFFQFLIFTCFTREIARELFSTFLLRTDPAPVVTESSIFIGAIKTLFEPIKQYSPIIDLCFLTPSKFAVIVPAPIFVNFPTLQSPT